MNAPKITYNDNEIKISLVHGESSFHISMDDGGHLSWAGYIHVGEYSGYGGCISIIDREPGDAERFEKAVQTFLRNVS